jgi:hypothetical protein
MRFQPDVCLFTPAQDTAYMFGDWAEETLLQAERALLRLSVPAPAWLNATYYAQKVKAKE